MTNLVVNSHLSNFFNYPAAVANGGHMAANLDLCLAAKLMAFSSEGF
jgi:hypothetical protein